MTTRSSATAKRRAELPGFDDFHRRRIAPELSALEERRHAMVTRMGQGGFIGAVAVVGAVWLGLGQSPLWALAPGLVALLAGLFAFKAYGDAKQDFKRVLVGAVAEFFGLDYAAEPGGGALHWFRELSLLPGYDRSSLEDGLQGSHNEVAVEFVEAHLEERRTRRTKKGTETYYVTVFRGLLCQFSFSKRFQGWTVVKTDQGGVFNWFQGLGTPGERVRLEDPRFEDAFEVWGTDQVEARYLLTPTFMERLLALDAKFGGKSTRLAFDAERLLIAISMKRDLLEGGSVFARADDPARIDQIVDEIALLLGIVDDLQLHLKTRI